MLRNMLMAVGEPAYTANAVRFDGISDSITRASQLDGVSDSKLLTVSCWLKRETFTGTSAIFDIGGNGTGGVQVPAPNIQIRNSSNNDVINTSGTTALTLGDWDHLLISFDLTNSSKRHVFINGVEDGPIYNTYSNDNMDFTQANLFICRLTSSSVRYKGDIADLYINLGTYIDPTVTANLRKFIDVAGKPVNLGETGEKPTGSSPIIYLSKRDSEVANDFATNKGTGGTLTLVGALADSTTSPSD